MSLRIPHHNVMEDSDDVWWGIASLSIRCVGFMNLCIVNITAERYIYGLIISVKGISRNLSVVCQPSR